MCSWRLYFQFTSGFCDQLMICIISQWQLILFVACLKSADYTVQSGLIGCLTQVRKKCHHEYSEILTCAIMYFKIPNLYHTWTAQEPCVFYTYLYQLILDIPCCTMGNQHGIGTRYDTISSHGMGAMLTYCWLSTCVMCQHSGRPCHAIPYQH